MAVARAGPRQRRGGAGPGPRRGRDETPPAGLAPQLQPAPRMSAGIWAAASGAAGQITALDVAANNVANAGTAGFRSDQMVFRQRLATAEGNFATRSLKFATVGTVEPNLAPGPVVVTDRRLDVAIKGEGFFTVSSTAGERYTRAGAIRMRADGVLTTSDGDPYLNPARRPITVPRDAKVVAISADGSVVADGVDTGGKLLVVKFPGGAGLEKDGNVLLRATGRPVAVTPDLAMGALEQSNTGAIKSMNGIMTATRSFEMLTKVIEAFSEADRRASTELMKRD